MTEIVELKVVKTDTSGYGFKEQPNLKNSNGCKCSKGCIEGTGSNPCENCNNVAHRKDGTMGCDEIKCMCASAVAYRAANPEEFA